MNGILAEALRLASRGYRVHPIVKGQKYPAIKNWPTLATTDPTQIENWFHDGLYDLGICTGKGLIVIDVDDLESWRTLLNEHDTLSLTYTVQTPSGGFHFYFRLPEGIEIRNDQAGKLGKGIDIRCDGGQVVAPPTAGYQVVPGMDGEPVPIPEWLLELVLPKVVDKPADFDTFASQASYIKPARQESVGNRPGDAFNAVATCDELLVRAGWTFHHSDSSGNHYTRPGKNPRDGISATVWHDNGRCTNWSTNSGLEVNGWLTPYSLLAQLEFNGDYRATTRALGQEGWGTASSSSPTAAATVPQEGTTEAWAGDPPGDDWAGWEPYDWTMLDSTDNPRPTILAAEIPGEEMKEDEL